MSEDQKVILSTKQFNVATLLLNFLLLGISVYVNFQTARNADDREYVQMAITILSQPKDLITSDEPNLRAWAVKVLDEKSPVPFGDDLSQSFLNGDIVFPTSTSTYNIPKDSELYILLNKYFETSTNTHNN